jgi:hypothetical protein
MRRGRDVSWWKASTHPQTTPKTLSSGCDTTFLNISEHIQAHKMDRARSSEKLRNLQRHIPWPSCHLHSTILTCCHYTECDVLSDWTVTRMKSQSVSPPRLLHNVQRDSGAPIHWGYQRREWLTAKVKHELYFRAQCLIKHTDTNWLLFILAQPQLNL